MKMKDSFALAKLINNTNCIQAIREVGTEIFKVDEKKENIYINIKANNIKKIENFEKALDKEKDLTEELKKKKVDDFYNSLIDKKAKEKLDLLNVEKQDLYWNGINKIVCILAQNEEDFYKFISIYKNMDIEVVKEADMELAVETVKEVINDKSFLSLMKLLQK